MLYIKKVVLYIFVACTILWLARVIFDLNLFPDFPVAFIAVFFWGVHILLEYILGQTINFGGITISAGDHKNIERLAGAAIGLILTYIAIYGYSNNWAS